MTATWRTDVPDTASRLDPALLAVLANRFEAIVREMTNTLLRTGRSAVIAVARDFSCAIATADDELLAAADGLPVHVFGAHLQTAAMRELHPDLREGDAFLDNDPYVANTHAGDHTIMVPVFVDGEHLFTTSAKAHQADIGNSIPSSYHPFARDVYEEGALIFSAAQVQRDYRDIDDIIRMCRRRIRVPDQWYGDYLAMLGAARIGEKRLKEVVDRYGIDTIRAFIKEWLDYSERRIASAIGRLPEVTISGEVAHDPVGPLVDGVPVRATVSVSPQDGYIDVDLRDNIDCVPAGVNETMVCSINNAVSGVLNVLEPGIPVNSGSFRRLRVHLREGAVVGIPLHPTCCSLATTNVADRLINVIQHAFTQIGDGHGLAEGGAVIGTGFSVISGVDRRTGKPYINQLVVGTNGGPGTPSVDGWITYNAPGGAGLVYRNSIEIDEHKYPMHYDSLRLEPDSGGAGRFRGAPAATLEFGPTDEPMSVAYSIDGYERPARGALGGLPGSRGAAYTINADGTRDAAPTTAQLTILPGQLLRGEHGGGGGYGSPLLRDPELVLDDVLEGYVTPDAARDVYGVVFTGSADNGTLAVDEDATETRRAELGERTHGPDPGAGPLSSS
jgi:N-methylhydantoinase B